MADVHRTSVFIVAAVSATLWLVSGANATLKYEPVRTADSTFIVISGDFTNSDNLDQFELTIRQNHPTFVTFNSPGGNVVKAIELGRLIRQHGLDTIQIKQLECASACALAFFGGVHRIAEPGAIGVHKASLANSNEIDTNTAISSVQSLTAIEVAYMTEMGVDPALLQLALAYEANDLRYLSGSEMARYRVTTAGVFDQTRLPTLATIPGMPIRDEPTAAAPSVVPDLTIPTATSGRVRHPAGYIGLRVRPDDRSAAIGEIQNGTRVRISGRLGNWYRIIANGHSGYAHDTWILVDQFQPATFDARYIQVKSFSSYESARSYVLSSQIPVQAELSRNGWFAIVLRRTFDESTARQLLNSMKSAGSIPADSFVTYGNNYVRDVCCN